LWYNLGRIKEVISRSKNWNPDYKEFDLTFIVIALPNKVTLLASQCKLK
jgi:hypothetical protein